MAQPKSIAEILQELWALLTAYAKQETVDPLRSLGRYLGFGLGGAALMALGLFFLALSGLRALQTETGDVFTGAWSAAPYAIVAIVLIAIAAFAASRINRGPHSVEAREAALARQEAAR